MRNILIIPLLLLLLIMYCFSLKAQTFSTEVVASSGNEVIGEEALLSWTIGESFTEILNNNSGIQTQGFHQTYANKKQAVNPSGETVHFYPNPVYGMLFIHSEKPMNKVQIQLFSANGERVLTRIMNLSGTGKLDLSKLTNGIYQLRLNGETEHNYKFVKLNN